MAGISTHPAMRGLVLLAALSSALPAWAGGCAADSGERTAALVELYTAEQCSACPPAERWLATLGSRFAPDRVVPLSLHVDSWDYLAAKDPYARQRLSARQRNLLLLQRMALVYSPQVLLQGRDFRDWKETAAVDAALERINAQPARARLTLEIRSIGPRGLAAVVQGQILDAGQIRDSALYLAALQSRRHSYVVLEWQGPIAPRPDGHIAESRSLALLPAATPGTSGVAAFVQNRRTGEVLQALLLVACSA
jgi:hypothetical protein